MERLDSILQKHTASAGDTKDKLLGASFIVVNKDGTLYSVSSGRIGMNDASPAWSPDTFTWMASLTKLVTITAVMQLVERGLVMLEDDMRELIPQLKEMQVLKGFDGDVPVLEDNTKPITLLHLLTHTVGLGYDLADPDLMKWSKATGRTATNLDWSLDGFSTALRFPPGEGWYYGTATDWAGQVLEKITGGSLSAYLKEHVFDPLDMRDSTFWPETLPHVAGRTAEHTYRQEAGTLRAGPATAPREHSVESGGSGLFTTAADYARFMTGFLAGKLLGQETMEKMLGHWLDERQEDMLNVLCDMARDAFVPEFPPGLRVSHCIGGVVNKENSPGKRRKGSVTWSGLCNSRWWIDPTTGIGAVLVVNVQPHGDPVVKALYNELESAVYDDLLESKG